MFNTLFLLLPSHATLLFGIMSAAVLITALRRLIWAFGALVHEQSAKEDG